MSLIKLEIRLKEIHNAVEAFKSNRKRALDSLSEELRKAVSFSVNELLQAEIDLFLGSPDQADNKRNGYQPERTYVLRGIGGVQVRLPKDRLGRFESSVIPASERVDPRVKADMAILQLCGLSTRTLSMISRRLLGVEYSKDSVSNTLELVKEEARAWLDREISNKYWALYIDGTNFRVQRRGSTAKEPSLVVLGVDENNFRSILAIEPGTKDNVESWRAVFASLRGRGLRSSDVRLGIMDGLPGLERCFKEEFPNARTQRCWVHAKANSVAKAPARLRQGYSHLVNTVMYAESEDAARQAFSQLQETMGSDGVRAVSCLEKDLESLLTFFSFDKKLWTALRTTNSIENINRQFKRRIKGMDTIGESTLETVLAFTALKIEINWRLHRIDSGVFNRRRKEVNSIQPTIEEIGLMH